MSSDATTARLASIRARADAATAGPWEVIDCTPCRERGRLDVIVWGRNETVPVAAWADEDSYDAADSEFIAAARTDIPFLLDQLAAAEAKIAQVQTLAEDFISAHDGDQGWDLKALNYLHREGQAILSASPVSALDAARADAAKQALLDAAEVFATSEGVEATMFANDNVEAVRATEAWLRARAEQIGEGK